MKTLLLLLLSVGIASAQPFADTTLSQPVAVAAGGGGGGAITLVSSNLWSSSTEATSHSIPISGTVLANDLIIIGVSSYNAVSGVSGYTLVTNASDFIENITFYKIAAGGETTAALTGSLGGIATCAMVWRNLSASAPLDKVVARVDQAQVTAAGTTPTTSTADQFLFAMCGNLTNSTMTIVSVDNSFTLIGQTNSHGGGANGVYGCFAYRVVSSTGAYICNFTFGSAGNGNSSASISTWKQ